VIHAGVKIVGPTDLPSRVAVDASQMYSRNVAAFLARITGEDSEVAFNWDDQIVADACITHAGRVTHPVVRRSLGLEVEA
jgi:NAD(P) transhydrogenase subunit alpha